MGISSSLSLPFCVHVVNCCCSSFFVPYVSRRKTYVWSWFSQLPPNFNIPYCTCTHRAPRAAILVTAQHVLRSRRRRRSELSVFFSHHFFVSSRIYTTSSFHPVFLRLFYTSAADGIYIIYCKCEPPGAASRTMHGAVHYYDIIFYSAVQSSRASHSGTVAAASLPTAVQFQSQPPTAAVVSFLFGSPIIVL